MRAGWMRHRVTIQARTAAQDGYGERQPAWADVATVWASVEPLRGREYLEGRQEQADISHRVAMRHRPGVSPAMRLQLEGGRVLVIESVINPLERGERLELMCRELIEG
jgi:SPP1 family predicted phage head-tail adaptor